MDYETGYQPSFSNQKPIAIRILDVLKKIKRNFPILMIKECLESKSEKSQQLWYLQNLIALLLLTFQMGIYYSFSFLGKLSNPLILGAFPNKTRRMVLTPYRRLSVPCSVQQQYNTMYNVHATLIDELQVSLNCLIQPPIITLQMF